MMFRKNYLQIETRNQAKKKNYLQLANRNQSENEKLFANRNQKQDLITELFANPALEVKRDIHGSTSIHFAD